MIFNTSGGGDPLNFKVVGGAVQPSDPKENTIWVNTGTAVTGWTFSATAPGSPTAGMVWFAVGAESAAAFNALKKNGITVYPLAAKQYINGAWVDRTAKAYQKGAWVAWWDGGLYVSGDTYSTITGGWGVTSNGVNANYPNTGSAPTVTYGGSYVRITQAASKSGLWHTKNKVSLAGRTKLSVSLSNGSAIENTQAYLQIRTSTSGYSSIGTEVVASVALNSAASVSTSKSIDLTSLNLNSNEKYFVCISVYSTFSADIKEIRLS